jgi:hypothetical protein
MPPPTGATRRQVILGGAATIVSLGILGTRPASLLASIAPEKSRHSLRDLLHVMHPASASFDAVLDKHYPGLTSLSGFDTARPLTLIIRNKSKRAILALSATWSVIASSGTQNLHSYGSFFRSTKLLKASRSGQYPVIKPEKLCILSPFFCWTPSRYRKVASPLAVVTVLRESPIKNQLSLDAAVAASVRGRLDAAIASPQLLLGPDRAGLGSLFRITRNAEHDEALSLLQASVSRGSLRAALVEHSNAPLEPQVSLDEWLYRRARIRYAGLLQRALRRTDQASLQKLLEAVKASPPTVLTRGNI